MAAIDLIVLGALKQQPLSAYELQKLVEQRRISRWVRVSTPSIYKKVVQLEQKGLLKSVPVRAGHTAEKAVYSLTPAGEAEFVRLMQALSAQPVRLFLDCNAVLVNLDSLPPEARGACLAGIAEQVRGLRTELAASLREKAASPEVPPMGLAVLRQQLALAEAMESWIATLE